ncbi:MAG: recombination protein O N-terminal domain-containing protein [Patescibacteria group bacterium]
MKEFVTEAIVMNCTHVGEWDITATLFTKEIGRVEARAVGGKKPCSKFAPHLDQLNLVTARLVEKNAITLTDVLTENRFNKTRKNGGALQKALKSLAIMNAVIPAMNQDQRFWLFLTQSLEQGKLNPNETMKILGYDAANSKCGSCKKQDVSFFVPDRQIFLCAVCKAKISNCDTLLIQ